MCFSFLFLKQGCNASVVTKVTKPEGIKLKEEPSLDWEGAGGSPSFLYFHRRRDAVYNVRKVCLLVCCFFRLCVNCFCVINCQIHLSFETFGVCTYPSMEISQPKSFDLIVFINRILTIRYELDMVQNN